MQFILTETEINDIYNLGLEHSAKSLEEANDETSRLCLIQAIRDMKKFPE